MGDPQNIVENMTMNSHLVDVDGIDALNVPLRTQPNREQECLLYSLYMVLTYCESTHPSENLRNGTTVVTPEELKQDHITIRESGWAPSPEDLEELSDHLREINASLHYWTRSPPMNAFEDIVEDGLNNNLPTIAVVDAMRIQEIDSEDGQHAIVVTGLGRSHVTINDPWGSRQKRLKKGTVIDAWDTQLNRLITFDTNNQGTLKTNNSQEVTQ